MTYRIWRNDKHNLIIQQQKITRKGKTRWETISYHGNSAKSLVSGLYNVLMAEYTPEDVELLEQLKKLEIAVNVGLNELEEMIKCHNTLS